MHCLGLGCNSSHMTVVEHEPVKKMETKAINRAGVGGNRCFCSLPMDLLLLVLGNLSFTEILSFRAVCRCWRQAFLQCQNLFQRQSHEQLPWIVFYTTPKHFSKLPWIVFLTAPKYDSIQPILYTTGKLGHSWTRHVYNVNIPELCGSRFLLSKYGWLLLFSTSSENPSCSSLFFLNPFSGSRINLPFLDVPSLNWPIFSISSPPTSQDCIIFVISCSRKNLLADLKISICHNGEDAWTTKIYPRGDLRRCSYAINVVFSEGTFYCLHQSGDFSTYTTSTGIWKHLTGPSDLETSNFTWWSNIASYIVEHRSERIFCFDCPSMRVTVKLKDPMEVVDFPDLEDYRDFILRYTKGILQARKIMKFDSFNVCSWFGLCEFTEDGTSFNWRRLMHWPSVNQRYTLFDTTIAWLEPRLIHPLNLRWSA
ncbi:F-box protein At3g56470-like [Cornus florida]|uniref:F-box protein At3g56470-like n=1 Tax=Cornus florida TaxID=4283 RepID=UPI00289A6B9E|nr:F-box protein At3g56470-like [Cornus florida]